MKDTTTMNYNATEVPLSIWGDKGVTVYTATKPNPNINDVEFIKNDKTLLKGTYIVNKNGELYRAKDVENLILSIMYDGKMPSVKNYGESIENLMAPHINVNNPKEVAKQLHDLNAIYILTVESFGRTEDILENTKQVRITSSKPSEKAKIYGLKYKEYYGNIDGVALIEIEEPEKINKILKDANILKDETNGVYHVKE
ncbi:MAG: hypothetical protein ABIF85_05485 [Nanoarchaeota archaeon]|nr:hypothetical protein [Nanoarchaeota archaeon]MBU4299773.1 hypothetical protein [Nanoarchaeota archaeon]MBU4452423.1 hypothetical protein [Nanoarchaeota archaeon]MCG2723157.1 hypothetical protein [archaeon]